MFHSARVKLTAYYLLIIVIISVSFSVAMYKVLTSELNRVERIHRLRVEHGLPNGIGMVPPSLREGQQDDFLLDPKLITETKNRLKLVLAIINFVILGGSAGAGYFLAGRTLKPIKDMVDEQSRFITDASHELRTPLTSLRSEIEVNLRDKKLTLAQTKRLLRSNLEEVNNLQILSDDLIKLTQYQKGDNGLTVARLSLATIIGEAVKKVAKLAKNKKVSIVNKTKDFIIEGNSSTLIELFVIFLDNAIKYSPEHSKVSLNSERTDGYVLVHLADQGMGIDEKDVPHIFDRFYRADKSRIKLGASGYGLGLSIARQIVDKHSGSIKVQSKLNEGTTFTVKLPLRHPHGLI